MHKSTDWYFNVDANYLQSNIYQVKSLTQLLQCLTHLHFIKFVNFCPFYRTLELSAPHIYTRTHTHYAGDTKGKDGGNLSLYKEHLNLRLKYNQSLSFQVNLISTRSLTLRLANPTSEN